MTQVPEKSSALQKVDKKNNQKTANIIMLT